MFDSEDVAHLEQFDSAAGGLQRCGPRRIESIAENEAQVRELDINALPILQCESHWAEWLDIEFSGESIARHEANRIRKSSHTHVATWN
jgi:hypothetical protein